MSRTRVFDPDVAIDAAVKLFLKKGYSDCSIDDIVESSGVARYGIYQEFGDKDTLFRLALTRYLHQRRAEFDDNLDGRDPGIIEIRNWFRSIIERIEHGERHGCLGCQAAGDRAGADPEVAIIVAAMEDNLREVFGKAVDGALSKGEIRKLPRELLIEFIVGLNRNLGTLVRSETSTASIKLYIEASLALLER
ncbi:MAG: TetR/AcrR family transcriptional repressor of nem operon [Porticoccaceae bacterium]|jgi:TetR/AcrR family transcriptional repressor of nem operon